MASPRKVAVVTHGYCFDGAASAALFTRLLTHIEEDALQFGYRAYVYGASATTVRPSHLDGDINAVLDFRYARTSRLTWYFDHHATGLQGPDEDHFQSHQKGRFFFDPSYGSCAKLISDVAARFGFHDVMLEPLIEWADRIDAARFDSAEQAVLRQEPELRLMTILEHNGDAPLLQWLVPRLATQPLMEVAGSDEVQEQWKRLEPAYLGFTAHLQSKVVAMDRVVFADIADQLHLVGGKFVTYALYPDKDYSVVLSKTRTKLKISIGFNPWARHPRSHDISAICARHGGGGHPVVGAIGLPLDAIDRARALCTSIIAELNGEPQPA